MRRHVTADEYILDRVVRSDTCWLWTQALTNGGYATANYLGRKMSAHRLAYEAFIGPIPENCDVDHLCGNRSCMKPDHLEAIPHRENMLRGDTIVARNASRTHCPHGHEYTPENTYTYVRRGRPERTCRTCRRSKRRS